MVGELIAGRYRPLERHAIGGMATVWRARDERTGEQVALKRIHPHLVADPAARARLEREATALRLIDHPAIVRPRDLVDDPDDPSLVMEFADGRPLSERIAEGPLPLDEAIAIASTIADALAVAHQRGVVHRDIKPANVLVEDDGALHLVDFGIASLVGLGVDGLTDARSMVGTLRYTAPERLAGEPASVRSDVWALGALLFEMLTGRPAVAIDDPAAALAASRRAVPGLDDLPPAIGRVIGRAMMPDPAARYRDAASFRDALDALDAPVDPDAATAVVPVVSPPPLDPAPPSGLASSSGIARGRWLATGAALAAALLLVTALARPTIPGSPDQAGLGASPVPSVAVSADPPASVPTPGPAQGGHGKGHGNGKGKD